MIKAEETTTNNNLATLNVCFAYTSTYEITRAMKLVAEDVKKEIVDIRY